MLKIGLHGGLFVTRSDGGDCRPRMLKSRAIVAVLARSPGHRKSRAALQALLWEDRQPEQAMSSLRTALADIRKSFGAEATALGSDHSEVWLDPAAVEIAAGQGALLDGFDVPRAPAFEDWLCVERAGLEPTPSAARPAPRETGPVSEPPRLVLLRRGGDGPVTLVSMQADLLTDDLAKSAEDLGLATVLDRRGNGEPEAELGSGDGLALIAESSASANAAMIRLKLIDLSGGQLVWSRSVTGTGEIDIEAPQTIAVVADFIDVLGERSVRRFDPAATDLPAGVLGAAGVKRMFLLGQKNFEAADRLFAAAWDREPEAIYLAWRGYLRTFLLGELQFGCKDTLLEEGLAFCHRALEAGPHNSMVLAASAHVKNMLSDDYLAAFELSSRSLAINRTNPLAWSSMGVAAAFLGDGAGGVDVATVGARLGAGTRAAFKADGFVSSAAMVAGDLGRARAFAERSHASAPSFAPPLRFLAALYCSEGAYEKAQEAARKLQASEPGFTLEALRSDGYPSASLRQAGLLDALPGTMI